MHANTDTFIIPQEPQPQLTFIIGEHKPAGNATKANENPNPMSQTMKPRRSKSSRRINSIDSETKKSRHRRGNSHGGSLSFDPHLNNLIHEKKKVVVP